MSAQASKPGKFITLEGGEGTGKSTQAAMLAKHLEDSGIPCLLTREPGGSPGAEEIRNLLVSGAPGRWTPATEALLHSAARADHVARAVAPALAKGRWVVSDRFTDSTLAYQGHGHGLEPDAIRDLNRLATGGLAPDLTLILDIAVAGGLARAGQREDGAGTGEDRYERMEKDFHERLRAGFLAIAEAEPQRCVVIDAQGTVEAVQALIRAAVANRLGVTAR